MSRSVDERVVEMGFDNREFERNVATSMSTIDKLKESLNFNRTASSIDKLGEATRNVNVRDLGNQIDEVNNKFSTLEVIGVTALAKITSAVMDAGAKLVKSLTIDNVARGWQNFGKETTSVATIRAQGYALEEVERELEQLNWYTDETSYDFTSMVDNIGKFTASGQGLHESVRAMEGIANWAALSGQNASVASRAMYQLSQAMGRSLQQADWRSIQNAAMDTKEIREHMIAAGLAAGTLKEVSDGVYRSLVATKETADFTVETFAGSLTTGAWATSDVMMAVYEEYAGAVDKIRYYTLTHGVTASEAIEAIGDDLDEFQIKAFKAAQQAHTWEDVVNSLQDAVTTQWKDTFKTIIGNEEEATELYTALANGLYDVVTVTGKIRNQILEGWKELGGRDDLIKIFTNLGDAVTGIIRPIQNAWAEVFGGSKKGWEAGKGLYYFTHALEVLTEKLILSREKGSKLQEFFEKIFRVLKRVKDAVVSVLPSWDDLRIVFGYVGGAVGIALDWLIKMYDYIKTNYGDDIRAIGRSIRDTFSDAIDWIVDYAEYIQDFIKKQKAEGKTGWQIFKDTGKEIVTGMAAGIYEGGKTALNAIGEFFTNLYARIRDNLGDNFFRDILDSVFKFGDSKDPLAPIQDLSGRLNEMGDKIKDPMKNFKDSLIGDDGYIDRAKTFFSKLGDAIKDFFDGDAFNLLAKLAAAGTLYLIGRELVNFYRDIKTFINGIANFVGGAGGIMKNLSSILENFAKGGIQGVLSGSKGMRGNKWSQIGGFVKDVALGIVLVAGALYIIADIDKTKLDAAVDVVKQVGIAIASFIGASAAAINDKRAKSVNQVADGFLKVSGGLALCAWAIRSIVNTLQEINEYYPTLAAIKDKLLPALGIIATIMTMFGLFAKIVGAKNIGKVKFDLNGFWSIALGFLEMSFAIKLLAGALNSISKSLGKGDKVWEAVGVVATLMGAMAVVEIALSWCVQPGSGGALIAAGAAMIEMAIAIDLAMIALGAIMAFTQLGGDPQAAVDIARQVVGGMVATMIFLGGVAGGVGAGTIIAAGFAFLEAAIGIDALALALILVSSIPTKALWNAVGALAALVAVIVGGGAIVGSVPQAAAGVLILAIAFDLVALGAAAVALSFTLLINAIQRLVDEGPGKFQEFAYGFGESVGMFFDGIIDSVDSALENLKGKLSKWRDDLKAFTEDGGMFDDFLQFGDDIVTGLSQGIINGATKLAVAINYAVNVLIKAFKGELGINSPSKVFKGFGGDILDGLKNGIKEKIDSVVGKMKELAGKLYDSIKEKVSDFLQAGRDLVNGLRDGINEKVSSVVAAARNLAGSAITAARKKLNERSPSRVFYEIGAFTGEGYINALHDYEKKVYHASEDMAGESIDGMKTAITAIASAVDSNLDYQPTIAPVMDLSNVKKGASAISAMLNSEQALGIASSFGGGSYANQNESSGGTTYSFVQNNYSPKALSRIDIYRQTKNQFSALERMATT